MSTERSADSRDHESRTNTVFNYSHDEHENPSTFHQQSPRAIQEAKLSLASSVLFPDYFNDQNTTILSLKGIEEGARAVTLSSENFQSTSKTEQSDINASYQRHTSLQTPHENQLRHPLATKKEISASLWAIPKRKISQPIHPSNRLRTKPYSKLPKPSQTKSRLDLQTNLLRTRSSSCDILTNASQYEENKLLSGFYKCDYKLISDDIQRRKSSRNKGTHVLLNDKGNHKDEVQIQRIYDLEEAKAFAFVVRTRQMSQQGYIADQNKIAEHKSDEPFILYKKGKRAASEHLDLTDIQAIDLQKLFDEAVTLKLLASPTEAHRYNNIRKTVVMTYDLACSSVDFLNELLCRFFIPMPSCVSKSEASSFETYVKEPAQRKVVNTLIYWMTLRYSDFVENLYLRRLTRAFLEVAGWDCHSQVAKVLKEAKKVYTDLLTRKISSPNCSVVDEKMLRLTTEPTLRVKWLSSNCFRLNVSDVTKFLFQHSSQDLAEQLTLIDCQMHKGVRHWQLPFNLKNKSQQLQFADSKSQVNSSGNKQYSVYQKVVEQTNFRTFFFIYVIISHPEHHQKLEVILKLLDIAEKCLKLRNFQSFCCILGALLNTAVIIQKPQLNKLSIISKQRRAEFYTLYQKGYQLRKQIAESETPKVPCLMLVAEDIEKLLAAQPTCLELDERKLINFKLMEELDHSVSDYFVSQESIYDIQPVQPVLDFFQANVMRFMMMLDNQLSISRIQSQLMSLAQATE